jgi:two-component system phosphate regulon sensor histidine kinase PhoR
LGSGEISFEIGAARVVATATRLSDAVSPLQCVLVRLRSSPSLTPGVGRSLAARLSRELRAPVTAIRGCSQTLLGGALDETERARRFVEMVGHNVEQLESIAEDLCAFAQIEPTWILENRRAVDVRPVLGSAARSHAHSVLRRGVAVRANPVADRVVVAAVPQLFERSLQGVVGELVRVARRGEEVTCAATRPESRSIAEIAIRREPGRVVPRAERGSDLAEDSDSLRMETVREVVHCHGGWLKACGSEGRLDSVTMFWPLWVPPLEGAA